MYLFFYILSLVECFHHLFTDAHEKQHKIQLNRKIIESTEHSSLSDISNTLYFINASFGTPPQEFPILIDTGSVTTWISNDTCDGCLQPRFNPNQSITLQQVNEDHKINYNIGSLDGEIVEDYVSIPNTTLNVSMQFMLTNTFLMPGAKFYGLLGLSSYNDRKNIFESGYEQKKLESPLFGMMIKQNPKKSYMFYNNFSDEFLGEVIWMPNVLTSQWVIFFCMKSMKIYGYYINLIDVTNLVTIDNGTVGLMDSGASCLWLDENIVDYLMLRFIKPNCKDSQTCPCESPIYPTIKIYLEGVFLKISPSHYMIKSHDEFCRPCLERAGKSNHGFQIFGDPAMQTIVALFDKENQRFGVYKGNAIHHLFYFSIIQMCLAGIMIICVLIYFYKLINN